MSEKEQGFNYLKNREKALEKSESLERIEKGLEVTLNRLEDDSKEKKGGLFRDRESRRLLSSHWKEDFWRAEEENAGTYQPKNAIEQTFIWNSEQAPIKGRIMDGFKLFGPIIINRENLKELKTEDAVSLLEKETNSIIVVDRERDNELAKLCKWARMLKNWKKDEEEIIFIIAKRVREIMGGALADGEIIGGVGKTRKRKEVFLGDIKIGACHERALLFEILAEEAGIETNMEKTKWFGSHSYNPVVLKNGERLIIDVMYSPSSQNKYFDELSYQEFKEMGGFPRFGSNRSPFKIYQDAEGRFRGGELGVEGLRELLNK